MINLFFSALSFLLVFILITRIFKSDSHNFKDKAYRSMAIKKMAILTSGFTLIFGIWCYGNFHYPDRNPFYNASDYPYYYSVLIGLSAWVVSILVQIVEAKKGRL